MYKRRNQTSKQQVHNLADFNARLFSKNSLLHCDFQIPCKKFFAKQKIANALSYILDIFFDFVKEFQGIRFAGNLRKNAQFDSFFAEKARKNAFLKERLSLQ